MIIINKTIEGRLVPQEHLDADCWINMINPSQEELQRISVLLGVSLDHLTDPLDADERARLEFEDGVMLVVLRVPVENVSDSRIPFLTMPIGVIITPTAVVTVSRSQQDLATAILNGRTRIVDTADRIRFLIHLMQRTSLIYLRYLKDIIRRSDVIEHRLQQSMRNEELIELLGIEKSLVYFTTSLKANDIIMDKVLRMRLIQLTEDQTDLLEDAITENRQAIEMSKIHSDILSGTMDAFASIISNNMNMVMKFLTGFTIILMIPNIISGVYGMNIVTPFQDSPYAFAIVSGVTLSGCLLAWLVLARKRWM
ncbi:magnesium transporter CorA family protein [Desulfomicrobium escambiense]|uniref:magnesium transporter CorA family protein n=1 Tax=Desulfomicrobium escambiense TaxID=29503 RepID=UPI00041D6E93|nr:magnesium transporter CorA family protein [Desulfomicrobium escambiense]